MTTGGKIEAIVLAAGRSARMGSVNKLLLEIDGVSLVRKVVEAIQGGGVDRVTVVTGFERERVESALDGTGARFVFNECYAEGMGSSLSAGVRSVGDEGVLGILVCLADLPSLSGDVVRGVAERFIEEEGRSIVAPVYKERLGHPVVFPIGLRGSLASLSGDRGARRLMGEVGVTGVEVEDDGVLRDLDTRLDWERF